MRARETGAGRVLMGGAGLIPRLDAIAAASEIPVLDAHRAAIDKLARCVGAPDGPSRPRPAAVQAGGMSRPLERLLVRSGLASPAHARLSRGQRHGSTGSAVAGVQPERARKRK
jgi:hypothetical protein